MDNQPDQTATQAALRELARIIVAAYLAEHPLPDSEGTVSSLYPKEFPWGPNHS